MSESISKPRLPGRLQFTYAIGQLGWGILINIVALQLVFFYLPPDDAGLPLLISDTTFLLVLNAVAIIAASGRLIDAVTDPLIASWSDRSTHRWGRRKPFMALGALPAGLFLTLMFVPPSLEPTVANIIWLVVMQALFYISFTFYVTPIAAMMPEVSRDSRDRLNLATWSSIAYAIGVIVASQVPVMADLMPIDDELRAVQLTIAVLAAIAVVCLYAPVLTIDENIYADSEPSSQPMREAIRSTMRNPHFRYYVAADFTYFTGLTIILTGTLYYATVLLREDEALAAVLLAVMILVSFLMYPLVNVLARRRGKKGLVVGSFVWMAVVFLGVAGLGNGPLDAVSQAYILSVLIAVPLAFLGVLPNAILGDIAEHDAQRSGDRNEGMYYATRTLLQKFGQTFGVLIFAVLTTFGRDIGDDLGIRLSGVVGCVLCIGAAVAFVRYNESAVLAELGDVEPAPEAVA